MILKLTILTSLLLAQESLPVAESKKELTIEELQKKIKDQEKKIQDNFKIIKAYQQKFFNCDAQLVILTLDQK